MATDKSLTSTPALEGSLLRCQGHIGRSDRQRLRVLSVFLFLKSKCLHMLALPLSFLTTIHLSSSRAAIFVRETEREREREFCPLSGFLYTGTLRPVSVYRTEATRIGALGITAVYRQPYSLTSWKIRPRPKTVNLKMKMIQNDSNDSFVIWVTYHPGQHLHNHAVTTHVTTGVLHRWPSGNPGEQSVGHQLTTLVTIQVILSQLSRWPLR